MPCFFPINGFYSVTGGFTTNRKKAYSDRPLTVACGRCIGCRLKYSYNWAVRCMHEAAMHQDSIFLTLTYAPEFVPATGSLDKEVVPKFIADLRKEIGYSSIKYFHSGEYGDKLSRPHYHVLIFGWRPSDAKKFKGGLYPLYTSPTLERLWPYGFCPFGDVSFESAAYTARYATKKVTGKKALSHYERVDPDTGEVFYLQPEFATMSNRGGLGRSWLLKHLDEVYPSDSVLIRGRLVQPPRFYDKVLESVNPDLFQQVKAKRLQTIAEKGILSADQLRDLHRATETRFKSMMRSYE